MSDRGCNVPNLHVHGTENSREQVGVAMTDELFVCINIFIQRDGLEMSASGSRYDALTTCIELERLGVDGEC